MAAARRSTEGAPLAERESVRALLLSIPAYTLLILEALCEARGSIERRDLERVLRQRSLDVSRLDSGVDYLVAHDLVLVNYASGASTRSGGGAVAKRAMGARPPSTRASSPNAPGERSRSEPRGQGPLVSGWGSSDRVTLLAPRASVIAELVLGLSLPTDMPPDPPEDRQVLENERQVLAASTLVTHRRVKWTRECLPNKSSLKSFARGLGPDEPRIEALLLQGWRADLFIETSDSHIEPDVQRILRAASRGLSRPEASLIGSVEARLPSEGWVALGALTPHFREYGVSGDRDLMARCAGQFVFREYRGELFVARPLRPSHRTGDGHVTPSFEVLLGPDAHPEIGVIVGLFAELTRLDRVLTFKITEASVVNGLRAGRTVVEFLDALSAVGRHGVPENVSITVKDFASRASTIRPVWALEVPAAATDALMRELGAAAVASPRPGLVLASAQVSERDIAAAMLGAGLKPVSMLETPPAAEAVDERVTAAESPRREPDSALRDAVRREREGGFQGSYRAFETVSPRFHDLPERDAEEAGDAAPSGIRIHPGPAFATAVRALVEGEDVMTVATRSRSDGGAPLRTRTVAPSALIRRGNELVLLAEDVNTEANHAFPLSTIEWIEVQRPPAAALEQVAAERGISPLLKLFPSALGTERNDPCPCGSGKKYDRCHGVTN